MPRLPPSPSFSELQSSRSGDSQPASSLIIDAVLSGLDAAVPFAGGIPRLTIGAMDRWTKKKHENVRTICKRIIDLHAKGEAAMKQRDDVPVQWCERFVVLQEDFEVFAKRYEPKRHIIDYLTGKIRPVDDQQALAAFDTRIDAMFMTLLFGEKDKHDSEEHAKQQEKKKEKEEEERMRSESASTVDSSP